MSVGEARADGLDAQDLDLVGAERLRQLGGDARIDALAVLRAERHADEELGAVATEILNIDRAELGHRGAHFVGRLGAGEARLHQRAAGEVDAGVETHNQHQRQAREDCGERDRQRGLAKADEVEAGIVGNDLEHSQILTVCI